MEMTKTIIHKFEEAGLGIAPFDLYDVVWKDTFTSCEFCATAIKERCILKDVNGKLFIVGNECVRFTGDAGLIDTVKQAVNKLRTERRHEREAAQIWVGRTMINFSEELKSTYLVKHNIRRGNDYFDDFIFDTMKYGGNAYKLEFTKKIRKIAEEILSPEDIKYILDNQELLIKNIEFNKLRLKQEKEAEDAIKKAEWEAKRKIELEQIEKENEFIVNVLKEMNQGGFVTSMLSELKWKKLYTLSPRQLDVLCDIYGKSFGNRNTKEYGEACVEFREREKATKNV